MFHSYLDARQYGVWERRTVWQLRAPLLLDVWNGFIKEVVPTLFYTDFASVPRHFHMYDYFGGICNAEAAGHDYNYRKDAVIYVDLDKWPDNVEFPEEAENWIKTLTATGWYSNFPKELADYIFRQSMIENGEAANVYSPMYAAVRVAGESSFHRFMVKEKLPCERIYRIGKEL